MRTDTRLLTAALVFNCVLSVERTIEQRGWPEALPVLAWTLAASLVIAYFAVRWLR